MNLYGDQAFFLFYFLFTSTSCYQVVAMQYRAGVYAHHTVQPTETKVKVSRQEALHNMMKNLEIYSKVANAANIQGVQILVFPEDGIYGFDYTRTGIQSYLEYIPDPLKEAWNPCKQPNKYNNTEVQRNLSCMALNNSMYIIANMGDIQICDRKVDPKCPNDGHYQFNTDVVYCPNGTLLARYHKTHLYFENQFDPSPLTEHVYFNTSFGRFGVFTCFDILFRNPAIDLIEYYNITNIVFPVGWNDIPPLFSAIQFHSAFAKGMGVNLLAANIQLPEDSFHGSGIYTPVGYLEYYYNDKTNEPKLLVADVTSVNNGKQKLSKHVLSTEKITNLLIIKSSLVSHTIMKNHTKYAGTQKRTTRSGTKSLNFITKVSQLLKRRKNKTFRMDIFNDTYTLKVLENPGDVISVCDNNLCCELDYQVMEGTGNLVVFGVFDGLHVYLKTLYLQVCILLECAGPEPESCNKPNEKSNLYFREFRISGNFSSKYIFPEVLVNDSGKKTLASGDLYDYHDGTLEIINGLRLPLLSAALLSRDYDKD